MTVKAHKAENVLTDAMQQRLKELGATHYAISMVSATYPQRGRRPFSYHFFKGGRRLENGFSEVAYFMPDMHSLSWGELSGFNEVERMNAQFERVESL